MSMRSFFVLASAALAWCACGSQASHASDASGTAATAAHGSPSEGSSSGRSSDVSSNDTSSPGSSTPAAAAAGAPLVLRAWGGGPGEVAAEVGLAEPGVGPEQTCTAPLNAGACQLTTCQNGGIGSPTSGYGNLGPIFASVGTTTLLFVYDFKAYTGVGFPSPIALGMGDSMAFHGGNGDDVPKFDVSAIIPGLAVMTSPVVTTDGGAAIIDTSRDLSVTWSPIAIGEVHFQLEGGDSLGGLSISVTCQFAGDSGSGVVSREFLASLQEMSGGHPTYAAFDSELDAVQVVDGLTIETWSYPTSSAYTSFNVTFQ
jgi:hypothetical protein